MTWLTDLVFDLKMSWQDFRLSRQWRREARYEGWEAELTRLREKGL
jgi:hypothetical protein